MHVGIRTYILTRCIFVCMWCIVHVLGICIVDIHVGTISIFARHCNDDVICHLSGSSIVCILLIVLLVHLVPDALVLLALVSLLAPAAGGLVSLVLAGASLALLLASVHCCTTLLPPFLLLVCGV